MSDQNPPEVEPLVETENYAVLRATGEEGEVVYHVELFNMTLHFFDDEWQEFVTLINEASKED
jgi:hypothetical protein